MYIDDDYLMDSHSSYIFVTDDVDEFSYEDVKAPDWQRQNIVDVVSRTSGDLFFSMWRPTLENAFSYMHFRTDVLQSTRHTSRHDCDCGYLIHAPERQYPWGIPYLKIREGQYFYNLQKQVFVVT